MWTCGKDIEICGTRVYPCDGESASTPATLTVMLNALTMISDNLDAWKVLYPKDN